jgi:hypothetical protein
MNIVKANVEFENRVHKYSGMTVIELAHELIRLAQPKLEIKITDERIAQFTRDAAKAYIESRTAWDAEEFTKLYVRMASEKYLAVERANHAYNEMILAMMNPIAEISDSEMLAIQNEALEFVKEKIGENNFDLIYDLKRENLKNQLIISKLTK